MSLATFLNMLLSWMEVSTQNHCPCPWLYCLFCHSSRFVDANYGQSMILTTGTLWFIACLVLLLVYDLLPAMNVNFRVWVDFPCLEILFLLYHLSACQCVVSIAVRYTFFCGWNFDTDMIMVPGWAHDDEHPWTKARQCQICRSTTNRQNCHCATVSLRNWQKSIDG